jgi:thiol-disulfide isomerase/thioredoxin
MVLLSLCRPIVRSLAVTCLLCVCGASYAQTRESYCEPSPKVKQALKTIDALSDADLTYKMRRERRSAMFQELLKKYPHDFHLQRRYQSQRQSGYFVDRDALLAEYRALLEKSPNDPTAAYLYARVLFGRDTKQAITELEKLGQRAPDFPWTNLLLAEIYTYPNFRDAAKANSHLKQWMAMCPSSMEAFWLFSRVADKPTMAETAQRLRLRLERSNDPDDLRYWSDLWTIEFKLKSVPEHAQLRQQITEDVKRIRAKQLNRKEWLLALQAGYNLAGDKAGQRWAEDELGRLFPKSETVQWLILNRWREDHPYPKSEDSKEQKQAYHRTVVTATAEWVKQWPYVETNWSSRLYSLIELDESSNEEVEAAYDGYAKAREQGGNSYSIPPIQVPVGRFFLKRGFHLEQVPQLLQKGLAEIEQIDKANSRSDLYPLDEGSDNGNLRYVRWQTWPLLAEAYARTKQSEKAREVLSQMAEDLKQQKPTLKQKTAYANYQSAYWQATAKVAEAEQRKLDALMAYQTALAIRPKSAAPKSGKRDELSDNTQRLWKELGGTDQGWQAYLASAEISRGKPETAETLTWDAKSTVLPDFDLTDLQGRKWTLANLKGKVAFINLWATWCGPCRSELPYVQKLADQLKASKDVTVLTLNIDEEVGSVEPFMKENKYTFPVILGQAYAQGQGVYSIPRNWIVSAEGKLMFEGIGFGDDGEEWIKRALEAIQKVKGGK